MALTTAEIKNSYPLPSYNYRVDIGSDTIGFSEVSGLNISFATTTYQESSSDGRGKPGPKKMIMPAQSGEVKITLKKGMIKDVSVKNLYDWIKKIQTNQIEKKDIHVRLCDEKGDAVISWTVKNAFPIHLEAPSFNATSHDAAIETMQLTGDSVTID